MTGGKGWAGISEDEVCRVGSWTVGESIVDWLAGIGVWCTGGQVG